MDRRSFLKTIPLSLTLPSLSLAGEGKGKNIFLYNYVHAALHSQTIPHFQQDNPDCVSHAAGLSIDYLQAIQHFLNGDIWYGQIATEILHAGTLKQIVRNRRRFNGGISVDELIKFLQEYGVIFRRKYRDFDFTQYSYKNCYQLLRGMPTYLLDECQKHTVLTFKKVLSWEAARDAIYNLKPVIIGSAIGFDDAKRDDEGFVKPKGEWYHAWALIGIKDRGRKGGCLMNSHGVNWIKGPRRHGQPIGSIWVDADVLHKMVKQYGDSYALSNFN